ncbi:MAG: lytic transglycosylase domain-containing protein [Vicinamibacteria bacterium]
MRERRPRPDRKRVSRRRTGRRRRSRRLNVVVGKAALTATLSLSVAPHGGASIPARRGLAGAVEAALQPAAPDLRLPKPVVAPLVELATRIPHRSRNTKFDEHINAAAAKHGVDVDLVRAIIQVESGFDHRARSRRGARGLMQLMPGTARDMGARNAFDPRQNIFAGVRYLRFLLDAFGGDVTLAAAAYNAGPTVVKRYGGVPPYEETQTYVQKVHGLLGRATPAWEPPEPSAPATAPGLLRSLWPWGRS